MKSCVCVSSNEIYDQRDDSLSPPLAVKGILGNLLNSQLQRQMETTHWCDPNTKTFRIRQHQLLRVRLLSFMHNIKSYYYPWCLIVIITADKYVFVRTLRLHAIWSYTLNNDLRLRIHLCKYLQWIKRYEWKWAIANGQHNVIYKLYFFLFQLFPFSPHLLRLLLSFNCYY